MSKGKWTTLALIMSLALNAAFIASIVYRKYKPRKPEPHPGITFKVPFHTDAGQRQKIESILRQFRIDSVMLKQDILTRRVEILEELGNPEYDAKKVQAKTAELNQIEDQLNNRFIDALLAISDILDSQQRLALVYQLSRNWYFLTQFNEKGGPHE